MLRAGIVAVFIILVVIFSPLIGRAFLGIAVTHDLMPQTKSKWLNYLSREPIIEHPKISFENGQLETNLYRPGGNEKHAAIVYVHGVNESGKDDPRLDNLAKTFTRAGFAVLVPGLPDMSPGKLNPKVISEIETSLKYIFSRDDIVYPDKIGVLGFSIGSGPAMIAVSRLENQIPIEFFISFGGYHDLKGVIKFSTTGHFSYQGKDYFIEPDYQSRWFFVRYYSDLIQNEEDSLILKQIAQMRISDSKSNVADLANQLSLEGKSIFELVVNTDPVRFDMLTDNLPVALKNFINELNPLLQVKDFSAELFIIHSINDNVIPYAQSLELRDNLKDKTRTNLFLFKIFSHVNPVFPPFNLKNIFADYIPETYKFWKLVYGILGYGN